MWNSYAKLSRLRKALQTRGVDPDKMSIKELLNTLERRGMTDNEMNGLAWQLIGRLEPPGCTMSHCKNYGNSSAPCNCGLERIPGRCKEYREYLKRCEERDARVRPATDEEYEEYMRRLKHNKARYVYPTDEELAGVAIPRDKLGVLKSKRNLEFGILPTEEQSTEAVDEN